MNPSCLLSNVWGSVSLSGGAIVRVDLGRGLLHSSVLRIINLFNHYKWALSYASLWGRVELDYFPALLRLPFIHVIPGRSVFDMALSRAAGAPRRVIVLLASRYGPVSWGNQWVSG